MAEVNGAAGNGADGGGRMRVFLADDHVLIREGLAALLENTPEFEVVGQCGNGLEVVELVERTRPDVVVLDIQMPGMAGPEVCLELRRRNLPAAILILSVHDSEESILRSLENGASGYMLKESARADLVEAMRTVAGGGRYLDGAIDKRILGRLHQPRQDRFQTLTPREREVVALVAEGLTNPKIAERLGCAVKTVDTHRVRLMRKLDVHDQTMLVRLYLERTGGSPG